MKRRLGTLFVFMLFFFLFSASFAARREGVFAGFFERLFEDPVLVYSTFIFAIIFIVASSALAPTFKGTSVLIGFVLAGFAVYSMLNYGWVEGFAKTGVYLEGNKILAQITPNLRVLFAFLCFIFGALFIFTSSYKYDYSLKIALGSFLIALFCGVLGLWFVSLDVDVMSIAPIYFLMIVMAVLLSISKRTYW